MSPPEVLAGVPRAAFAARDAEADTEVATLANGVRVLTLRQSWRETANVSVFVHTGSQHESLRTSGISHVVEHMAFKGTATRDCQTINLDAERLGAEVNAHTDKDHTAYHIDGLARDALAFVRMLGDIVRGSTFPAEELERERQVILHELADDEEDSLSTAFKLFDRACYGTHAYARPVIGSRRVIEHVTRDALLAYVQHQYTGCNVIVGVAGDVDPAAVRREAQAAFGAMPRGSENRVAAPAYVGGLRARALTGAVQSHVVVGFPIPPLKDEPVAHVVAAAVLGEGMSSPLLDRLRERRALAYHASCSADLAELAGQFVIEASTSPAHLVELFGEVTRLLATLTCGIDAVALRRARQQLVVRSLRQDEHPTRRLEAAALDLYVHGRVRSSAQWRERIADVGADEVRAACARMLESPAAVALAGAVPRRAVDRARELLAGPWAA